MSDIETLIVIAIAIYVTLNLIMILLVMACEDLHKVRFMLPPDLKKSTKMNWVGCSVMSLLCFIALPLIYLYRLFEFLFHI